MADRGLLDLKITYLRGYDQDAADSAFAPLWRFLEAACVPAARVDFPVRYHGIEPRNLALAMRQAGRSLPP